MPENTVSVTRPGKWGNGYAVVRFSGVWKVQNVFGNIVSRHDTKQDASDAAVSYFRAILEDQIKLVPEILEPLRGKNLACFCSLDQPCHADVLLELANK